MSQVYLVICLFVVVVVNSPKSYDLNSIKYLTHYGYLPSQTNKTEKILDEKVLSNAISNFQKYVGITVTGKINKRTEDMMRKPRCGMVDHPNNGQKYVIGGKWEKRNLTYKVLQYTAKLRKEDVDKELDRAFNLWERHTYISFTRSAASRVDIEIRFTPHGTPSSRFDGPGNVLAYAYFPQNGDVYFDDSEDWTLDHNRGTSFYYVAVHEIGHSIGLSHSNVRDAVMYPLYWAGYNDLRRDDIDGIQKLYGVKTAAPFSSTPSPPSNTWKPPTSPWIPPSTPCSAPPSGPWNPPSPWSPPPNAWNPPPNAWNPPGQPFYPHQPPPYPNWPQGGWH